MDERRYPPVGLGVAEHHRAEATCGLRACLLAAALAASLPATPVSAQAGIGLDDVVGRAAAYVAAYVDDLSNVVMEEDYRQTWQRSYEQRVRRRPPGSSSSGGQQLAELFAGVEISGVR